MNGCKLISMFSLDNAIFAFEEIEDALEASLSKAVPQDKMIEVYEGFLRDGEIYPSFRRNLIVKVHLSPKLELMDYEIRSTAYASSL